MNYDYIKMLLTTLVSGVLIFLSTFTYASGAPLWTFTPLTATTISVPNDNTARVSYLVTNQSKKSHTLTLRPMSGVSQITKGFHVCANPFVLSQGESCRLILQIEGSQIGTSLTGGPIVCQQQSSLQCYRPNQTDILNVTTTAAVPVLSASLSNLALKTLGTARYITITNTGSVPDENVSVSSPTLPLGTSQVSTCPSTLSPGSTCTITISPGSSATSDCNAGQGSAPTPASITISATNASSVTTDVVVLSTGCIYQQGYVFSIDDTTPASTSIGGETAALTNNSSSIPWWNGEYFTTNATSFTAGATNTAQIISTERSGTYAATLCSSYSIDSQGNSPCLGDTCYFTWYLPAICQIGGTGGDAGCPPSISSMQSSLPSLIGCAGSECFSVTSAYWSSTEDSTYNAWYEYFLATPAQAISPKNSTYGVRCARNLTP